MDIIEKTDYRKASPEAIYEARKIVLLYFSNLPDE